MNILIIHNNYTSQGGEESVVDFQIKLFRDMGHEVVVYRKQNDKSKDIFYKIGRFINGFFNLNSYFAIRRIVKSRKIDVAIVHNLYHKITPSVLTVLKMRSVPVFMVLHNYRVVCPLATLFHNGGICKECLMYEKKELRCITNNCTGNISESVFVALRGVFVRKSGILTKNIAKFITLSQFQKDILVSQGFETSQITVIPNAIDIGDVSAVKAEKSDYIAFVGRISPEKGIDVLFDLALRMPNQKFKVAGSNTLQHIKIPNNIEFCGYLMGEELTDLYKRAKMLIMTSKCYEGFPVVVLEAFKNKTAVIVPRLGALPNIVDDNINGIVYDIFDLQPLVERISNLSMQQAYDMGECGCEKLEGNYDSQTYYNSYIKLFEKR